MAYSGWLDSGVALIVQAVLNGLVEIPILVLGILSCVLIRRKGDVLRAGYGILHALWWLYFICIAFRIPAIIFSGYYLYSDVGLWLGEFGALFSMLTMALTTILLYFVGIGILQQHTGPKKWHVILKWTATGICVVMMILAIAIFGRGIVYLAASYDYNYDYDYDPNYSTFVLDTELATAILNWVLNLVLVGLGIYIIKESKPNPHTRKMVRIYMAAVMVWLVRSFYIVIIDIKNHLGAWRPNAEYYSIGITSPIFDTWTQFIVIVLLFVIGTLKLGGLWSNAEGRAPIVVFQAPSGDVYGPGMQPKMVPASQMGYAPQGQMPMYAPQYYPQGQQQQQTMGPMQPTYAVGWQPAVSPHPEQQNGWTPPGQAYSVQSPGGQTQTTTTNRGAPEIHEAPNNKSLTE